MLTRRGWMVAGGTVAVAGLGRVLAMPELFVMAAGAAALVIATQLSIRLPRPRFEATRSLFPAKIHAGGSSRVELGLRNAGTRRAPVVMVRDPFDHGRRQARFLVARLTPSESARAAYRLPTERRGVFTIGPLELEISDPFGLSARRQPLAAATQLTVYPAVDRIVPLPHTHGHDPHAGADHPTALGFSGDDFYALRAYEMGDDLRRVHWPSTARLDDLMIKQLEMPWQGRATVLLDNRRGPHTAASFELAVSAAASIVTACWGRGSLVRLVSTGGLDSGFAAGQRHIESIMEKLATIELTADDRLDAVLAGLRGAGNAGALAAIVTASVPPTELETIARLQRRFGSLTVVVFEPSSYGGAAVRAMRPAATASGEVVVRVTGDAPFGDAWNRLLALRGGSVRLVPRGLRS
jgi:uncharacterized protein (DUF58 family)